jgi:hypothetical protein
MADENSSSSEEFRSFIRELGIRAFDQLAARLEDASDAAAERSGRATRRSASLARLVGYWSGMQPVEKAQFFEQMIVAAQSIASTAPSLAGMGRMRKKKRGLPEEVRHSFSADLDIDEIPVLDLKPDNTDTLKKSKKKKKKKKDKLQLAGAGADTGNGKKKKKKKKKKKHKS